MSAVKEALPIDNLKFKYDNDHDVLHLFFGEPRVSYADEIVPGVVIRYADEDDSITGAIIMDYRSRNKKDLKMIFPININFKLISNKIH